MSENIAVAEITQIKASMSDLERMFEQGFVTDTGHIYFDERPLIGKGKIGNITLYSQTARPDPELKRCWKIINTAHHEYSIYPFPDGEVIAIQTVPGRLQLDFYLRSYSKDKAAAFERMRENALIIHQRLMDAGFSADAAGDQSTERPDLAKLFFATPASPSQGTAGDGRQKNKGGRKPNLDDDWAYEQIEREGRSMADVYPEWLNRIGERGKVLADPYDSFKGAISRRRKKKG